SEIFFHLLKSFVLAARTLAPNGPPIRPTHRSSAFLKPSLSKPGRSITNGPHTGPPPRPPAFLKPSLSKPGRSITNGHVGVELLSAYLTVGCAECAFVNLHWCIVSIYENRGAEDTN